MFIRSTWLVVICSCIAALVFAVSAQDKPVEETIKVNTALVSVPVIVSDHDGRYIPDLKQDDFAILQDGVNQKIEFFSSTEEPINIAVLIDTSVSTTDVLGDIKRAAYDFITLLEPKDRAMIISFDGSTHPLCPLTNDSHELKDGIKHARIGGGGTAMRDAVLETVRNQFKNVEGRKAIILLTDGKDNTSGITADRLIHVIEESDVIVYPVNFKTVTSQHMKDLFGMPTGPIIWSGYYKRRPESRPIKPPKTIRSSETTVHHSHTTHTPTVHPPHTTKPPKTSHSPSTTRSPGTIKPHKFSFQFINYFAQPQMNLSEDPGYYDEDLRAWDYLNRLANATGGRLYDGQAVNFNVFGFVVEELRRQYRLGYYPPEETQSDQVHALKVEVGRPAVVVRARSSYRPAAK